MIIIISQVTLSIKASDLMGQKPNIIILLVDDLGYKDVGFMGNKYVQTPNIDKLAGESMFFSNAYSSYPVCAPTRASIMSGRNPSMLGYRALGGAVPTDEIFISQALQDIGYTTAAFGKWYINRKNVVPHEPINSGFDFQKGVNHAGQPATYFYPFYDENAKGYKEKCNITDLQNYNKGSHLTHVLGEEASLFIKKNKEKSFFMYMSFYAVHIPIQAKTDVTKKYESIADSDGLNQAEYAALTEHLDDAIGKILNTLKDEGLEENTIIFFMGDNGGLVSFSNNMPLNYGKGSLYEGGIRTPMLVKWQGRIEGRSICNALVNTSDLAPTIAEITGARWDKKGKDGVNGYSIYPLIVNPVADFNRKEMFWMYYPYPHYEPDIMRVPAEAMRSGDWKLIHFRECMDIKDHYELYNLRHDIGERNNLVKTYPAKLEELSQKLTEWMTSTPIKPYQKDTYNKQVLEVRKRRAEMSNENVKP